MKPDAPRCTACGYTLEDARMHGDHHLCPGVIPHDPRKVAKKPIVKRQKWKEYISLFTLCKELDIEMDGVRVPGTAAAILNAIRSTIARIEDDE